MERLKRALWQREEEQEQRNRGWYLGGAHSMAAGVCVCVPGVVGGPVRSGLELDVIPQGTVLQSGRAERRTQVVWPRTHVFDPPAPKHTAAGSIC